MKKRALEVVSSGAILMVFHLPAGVCYYAIFIMAKSNLILVVNCTDPLKGRSDVETVGWDGSLSWETSLTVKCKTFGKEFWVNGTSWSADLTLTCGMDKKWTPSLPKCEWRHCFDPPKTIPELFLTQVRFRLLWI